MVKNTCTNCGGTGRVDVNKPRHIESTTKCRDCNGSGIEPKEKKVETIKKSKNDRDSRR